MISFVCCPKREARIELFRGSVGVGGRRGCRVRRGRTDKVGRRMGLRQMIVGLLNQKGGVGKPTLATHIAGEWASSGKSVTVIDADPQGSAVDWARTHAHGGLSHLFNVVSITRNDMHHELPAVAAVNDHVLIDGPPRVTGLARSTILASDMILIPLQPSSYDICANAEIVKLIKEAQTFKPALHAAFVINRCIAGTIIARDVRDALMTGPVVALRTIISQRVAYAESVATGQLVREIDSRAVVTHEISALAAEVLEHAG